MPEFDTRRPPQGPSRLSELLESVVDAFRRMNRHCRRWGNPAIGLLRSIDRHRWVTRFRIVSLVVLAVGLMASWQAYQEFRFVLRPPEYHVGVAGQGSCSGENANPDDLSPTTCYEVYTNATDAKSLEYITKQVAPEKTDIELFFYKSGDHILTACYDRYGTSVSRSTC